MKVKDLIETLKTIDPNIDVYCTSASGAYDYGKVFTAKTKIITIVNGKGLSGDYPKEKVVFVVDEQ